MGDMADLFLEQNLDFDTCDGWEQEKDLRCKHCRKRLLAWRQVGRRWVLIEWNGTPHSCHGYEPPLDVLKVLAKETQETIKKEALWHLVDRAKKRGCLKKMINIIPDADLVDLYACFVRDQQREQDNPEVGMSVSYKNELKLLKDEILRRIAK